MRRSYSIQISWTRSTKAQTILKRTHFFTAHISLLSTPSLGYLHRSRSSLKCPGDAVKLSLKAKGAFVSRINIGINFYPWCPAMKESTIQYSNLEIDQDLRCASTTTMTAGNNDRDVTRKKLNLHKRLISLTNHSFLQCEFVADQRHSQELQRTNRSHPSP